MKNSISLKDSLSTLTAVVVFLLSQGSPVFAANGSWTGTTDSTWSTSTNWSGATPGAVGTTTNADTATFSAPTPANGTAGNPVVIDSGRNIKNITFDLGAAPYVIGSTTGNALVLTAGGSIQIASTMTSGNVETVNAPLVLEGNYAINNNSTALASALQIGGSITAASGVTGTLTLGGSNLSVNNIVSGPISLGSGTSLDIVKSGAGYWDVTGNNTGYVGTTTISAGTLSIGNANALGSGTNINFSGGKLAADTAVSLNDNFLQGITSVAATVSGSNSISTSGNFQFTGTSGQPSVLFNNMTGTASFAVAGVTTLSNSNSTPGDVRFTGPGTTALMDINGGTGLASGLNSLLTYYGTGTFILDGTNNVTGSTINLLGGTTILNYGAGSEGNSPRLGSGESLFLGSKLVLSGGSNNVESVNGTAIATNSGATYAGSITATPGSNNTINLGGIAGGGNGVVNFQSGVAFTTSASGTLSAAGSVGTGNTGVFGGWATVGDGINEGFAANLTSSTAGTAIVAVPLYSYVLLNATLGNQNLGLTANASGTSYTNTGIGNISNFWKIDGSNGTASGTFNFARTVVNNFFGSENILYTGTSNYTIMGNAMSQNQISAGGTSSGQIYIEQYGTGTLTINNVIYGGLSSSGSTGTGGSELPTGVFSGAGVNGGTLIKGGTGVLVLTGTNDYVGATAIAQGTLSIGSDNNISGLSGTLTLLGTTLTGTVVTASVSGIPTSQLIVGSTFLGRTILSQSATGTLTLSGTTAVTGTIGSTYAYAGTQNLLINGTLQATSSFSLGESATASGGTVTSYRPIFISVNGATFDVTGTNTLTAPGNITPAGGNGVTGNVTLTKINSGTLILSGTDTYAGGTYVNGGTLELSFNTADGAPGANNILLSTGALTMGGGTLNVNGAATAIANSQTLASLALSGGNSTISATANSATSVGLTFTNGAIARAPGSTVDFVSPTNTSITLAGNANNPFLGNYAFFGTGAGETYAATGSTGVVQAASLTSASTGANSLTSATTNYSYVSPGATDTLTASSAANTVVFSTAGAQTIDLGASGSNTLTLNGLLNTNGVLTIQRTGGTGSLAIGSSNELIIGGSSNVNISAPITGAGALTDANTGTLALSGSNTYTGATTVNSGVLALTGGSLNGSNVTTSASGSGSISESAGAVIAGNGVTFTQASTGTSTLAGTNTYTGLTTVSNGELDLNATGGPAIAGNIAVSGGTAKLLQSNQINSASTASVSGGTLNIQGFSQTLAGVQLTGGTITGSTGVLTSTSAFDIQNGVASVILGGNVGLNKTTSGIGLLTAANTYTGPTIISNGTLYATSIVVNAGASNLGNSTSVVVLGSASTAGVLSYTGTATTFTRGFTVNAGGGEIDSANGILTIAGGNITSSGTTTFGGTGGVTVASNIIGGSVTNNAFGTVTLSGSNNYSGVTTLDNGVLNLGSKGALGGGNITFAGGTLQFSAANGTDISSKIVNSTQVGGIVIDTNSQVVTFASALSSSNTSISGLTKNGAGTLILSGANAYTGSTTVNGGTLSVSNVVVGGGTSNLGNSAAAVILGGGDLSYTGASATYTRGLTLTANSEVDTTTAGQTLTIGTGNIAGAFNLVFGGAGNTTVTSTLTTAGTSVTKLGTGTLTLTKANAYTGVTAVNAGTLVLNFGATGAPTSNIVAATGTLSLGGGTLNVNSAASGTNAQTMGGLTLTAGNSTISLTNNGATSAAFTLTGTIIRAAGSTVDFVSPTNTSVTLSGVTSNAFLGTYALYGTGSTETYAATSGTGLVQAATLTSASTGVNSLASATTAYSYVSPGATDTLTASRTANALALSTAGAQTIDLGASGANTLTLNGLLNTGGALTILRSGGTGSVVIGSNNELVIAGPSNVSISAPITGAGALTDSNTGTLALSGSNTYTGVTTINGGTVSASNIAVAAGSSNLGNAATAVVLNGGTLSYTGLTGTYTRGFTIAAGGGEIDNTTSGQTLTISTGAIASGTAFGQTTFGGAGNMLITSAITGNGGVVTKSTGTLTFTAVNTYTGATNVNSGTLVVNGSTAAGSTVTVGNNTAVATLGGIGTINGPLITSSTGGNVAHLAPGASAGVVGTLQVGSLGFTIGGGTNLDYDLNSSTTAGITFNDLISMTGGVLTLGGTTTFNFNALTSLSTSGTYTLISGANTINGFNSSNFVANGTGALTATFSTVSGSLVVSFAGAVPTVAYFTGASSGDLTSVSNYISSASGTTAVVGSPGPTTDVFITANTGSTGGSALTPNTSTNPMTINSLTLTGSGTPAGASPVTISGANAITINAGAGATYAAGNGIVVATGAANDTISAPIVLGASQIWTVTDASNTLTVSGTISGSGDSLSKAGAGKLLLSGNNTYSGGTAVTSGTLIAGSSTTVSGNVVASGPFGTGLLTLANGASLLDNGTAITLQNSLSLGGTITFGSTGSGSLTFNSTNLSVPATVTLTSTTTLVVTNNTTISDNFSGNFPLTKLGAGTLTLLGTSSSTAGTNVTAGTLGITNGASLGSGLVSLAGGTALQYNGGTGSIAQNISLTGTVGSTGAIGNFGGGTLTLSGTLDKTNRTLIFNAGNIDVTGKITGGTSADFNSDMTISGTNTVVTLDNGSDNYTGATNINGGGTLKDGVGTVPSGSVVNFGLLGDGAVTNKFDLNGDNQTVAAINSTSNSGNNNINTITNSAAGSGTSTLTLSGTNSDSSPAASTYGGSITDGSTAHTALAITGGTHAFSGASTFTGGTTISNAKFVVTNTSGSAAGTGAFVLNSTGTLAGTGKIVTAANNTINGAVQVGYNGTANTTGSLTLATTGTTTFTGNLTFNLNGASPGESNTLNAGSTGNVFFGAGTTLTLNLLNTTTTIDQTMYTLFSTTELGGGTLASQSVFGGTGFTWDTTTGKISGLNFSVINASNPGFYNNSYLVFVGNGQGSYNIDVQVVPEPGTWALMLGGLALLILVQRSKRKTS